MPSPTEITSAQLARLSGTPEAPVLIDLRIDADFDDDPRLIPAAFRHDFTDIEALAPALYGRGVVVYCQKGRKISQGAVALLRCYGIPAESLEGGQFAWRDAGLPMVPAAALPPIRPDGGSLWVTRHRPKIDRIACPWLIRRFVDPKARFLFVAPSEVEAVAEKFAATPFDIEGVRFSHDGDRCSFDVMIEAFGLTSDALLRLARVVRGADTNRHDLAPQSAGLLAASVGLSRMYRNDLEQLDAGLQLYDAFYRWARDGFEEGHDWPVSAPASGGAVR